MSVLLVKKDPAVWRRCMRDDEIVTLMDMKISCASHEVYLELGLRYGGRGVLALLGSHVWST